ncbi:ATP-dependent DNA helicase PIF1 [Teratosphaeria destructans]|uniref:ATP-dependent DNA helicase PIF1 n=1 Tax=Teratosphaeria destructans TaxID=418781 RepID=A0A9W7SU85_9PEZI|nr:ATP-dependent DNA helicase PIF1 [Teratosphaeria destructans]
MLSRALQSHNKENARKAAAASSPDYFKTSPPETIQHKSGIQAANYRNPLKPATASVLNGGRSYPQPRTTSGVKRTASGLAKALDGSFDDDGPGTQHKPIVVNDPKTQTQVMFDENDFDSDVDLDFEEPKPAVSYPKLSPQPKQSMPAPSAISTKPALYPTLPRQQQAQAGPARHASPIDLEYSQPATSQVSPPKSSAPLPWSSSPVEHITAPSKSLFKQFRYNGVEQALQNGPPPVKASKRRRLPWQGEEEGEQSAEQPSNTDTSSKCRTNGFTPLPKDTKKNAFPWNTTASAVKEQQRKHREESRKASMKVVDGTDEDKRKAKSTHARPARVFLSEEQQHVLNLVTEEKRSVFFTGSAGTGKSVLLREIISALRKKYQREPDRVAVTASTGLAACNVGGVTLHSFAGIGLGKEDVPELVKKIKRNAKAKHRWMRTKVLIVDEISMVDADLFDKLESIARQMRNNGRPFGGIQLVITGDFFQLPPVPEGHGRVAKFAFDAATWNTTIEYTIGLHHVFRQKDPVFAGMLNEMREGRLSASSIAAFRALNREVTFADSLEATELFPTRNEVERANTSRLGHLQGEQHIFEARDGGAITDKAQRDRLLQNCMAPEIITLKKGAQVMLIKNVDESLVNGSIGKVIGFMSEATFDKYHENEELFIASQGGTTLAGSHDEHLNAEQKRMVQMQNGGISTSKKFPVVRFQLADGTSRDLLCQPENWKVELPNGEVQASRSQVPLILAWALSIHKAQGQTLDRVKVDLGKVFEKGQAYVALSRATSMQGLQVLRFDPKRVVAHEKVRTFYANLSRVELAEKNKERLEGRKQGKGGMAAEDYERNFVGGEDFE